MPLRPFSRDQAWLLPPTLDQLLPDDHPARFVAAFVDGLDREVWVELGIELEGEEVGAPAYHPRALLSIWLYGFMSGVRSCRKLEAACRDQIPYLWLTGGQRPDHNTLWRFYQAHRGSMRALMKNTVRTAVDVGLVDLAVQAVDGTKVMASAARERTYDVAGLQRLLERTEEAITELEAQNEGGDDPPPARLPEEFTHAERLQEQVRAAMRRMARRHGPAKVNLTDGDAQFMKGRSGIVLGYNAQAVVSPLDPKETKGSGMLITAADVVNTASDTGQLVPMLQQVEEMTGERTPTTLADGGYHTAVNLEAGVRRGQTLVMGEHYQKAVRNPYFKDQFAYDQSSDSYLCPQGQRLLLRGFGHRPSGKVRIYLASGATCRSCQAFGICTKDGRRGRALWIGPRDTLLRQHRAWMATKEARALYARRKALIEPVFGILKEQMGARRFLLRGLSNVKAEFTLLATAFNLRTLWRFWRVNRELIHAGLQQRVLPALPVNV